jgi:hypothetical protein
MGFNSGFKGLIPGEKIGTNFFLVLQRQQIIFMLTFISVCLSLHSNFNFVNN